MGNVGRSDAAPAASPGAFLVSGVPLERSPPRRLSNRDSSRHARRGFTSLRTLLRLGDPNANANSPQTRATCNEEREKKKRRKLTRECAHGAHDHPAMIPQCASPFLHITADSFLDRREPANGLCAREADLLMRLRPAISHQISLLGSASAPRSTTFSAPIGMRSMPIQVRALSIYSSYQVLHGSDVTTADAKTLQLSHRRRRAALAQCFPQSG